MDVLWRRRRTKRQGKEKVPRDDTYLAPSSFAYPVEDSDSDEQLVVATTRLDPCWEIRPLPLRGKFVIHPFSARRIPIIGRYGI